MDESSAGRPRWTRQQCRIYHRVQSWLTFQEGRGAKIVWVMLSSSAGSRPDSIAANHARLVRRIERKFGYRGIEHMVIQTAEGGNVPEDRRGVLHVLWAWKAPDGYRGKALYVPQDWLSGTWEQLHGARYVWIAPYKPGRKSRGRVSRYLVSQYVGNQDALVRYFWSWKRTFGVPVVKVWQVFLRTYRHRGFGDVLVRWHRFLSGGSIPYPAGPGLWGVKGYVFNLAAMREAKTGWMPVPSQLVLT